MSLSSFLGSGSMLKGLSKIGLLVDGGSVSLCGGFLSSQTLFISIDGGDPDLGLSSLGSGCCIEGVEKSANTF